MVVSRWLRVEGVAVGAEGSNSPETLRINRSIESAKKIYRRKIFPVAALENAGPRPEFMSFPARVLREKECWCECVFYKSNKI